MKKRRTLALVSALILAMMAFAGCANTPGSATTTSATDQPGDTLPYEGEPSKSPMSAGHARQPILIWLKIY